MNKTSSVLMVLFWCLIMLSCQKDENIPTQSPSPTIEWRTVFSDDFNRANTINGDLGSNWLVCDTTNASIMQITNNEVHAEKGPGSCPYAFYVQDIDYTIMRISVTVKTDKDASGTTIVLFARADTILSDGYFIGHDGSSFFMEIPNGTEYMWIGNLSANTTYVLEIITDCTGFEATMKDSATDSRLLWGGISDNDLVSGKVGFMVGAPSPNAVYVDDIRIEIPK